jgi:hypothetical protein
MRTYQIRIVTRPLMLQEIEHAPDIDKALDRIIDVVNHREYETIALVELTHNELFTYHNPRPAD